MSSFLARRAASAIPRAASIRSFSATPARPVARIQIIGNLADAPEVRATSTGREIIRYSVASNSGPKDNRQTSWFHVTSFEKEGPRRDFMQGIPKGSLVFVEGEAQMKTYEDSEGVSRTSLSVVQRNIEVLKRPNLAE